MHVCLSILQSYNVNIYGFQDIWYQYLCGILFTFQIFMDSKIWQDVFIVRFLVGAILIRISCIHFHMQEQQQKQLELILAIAKNGKLLDNKQAHDQPENAIRIRDSSTDNSKQKEAHQI